MLIFTSGSQELCSYVIETQQPSGCQSWVVNPTLPDFYQEATVHSHRKARCPAFCLQCPFHPSLDLTVGIQSVCPPGPSLLIYMFFACSRLSLLPSPGLWLLVTGAVAAWAAVSFQNLVRTSGLRSVVQWWGALSRPCPPPCVALVVAWGHMGAFPKLSHMSL